MKHYLLIAGFAIIANCGCNTNRTQEIPQQPVPEALEEKSSDALISKRSYEDLLENLYAELAEKDAGLKDLEKKIDELPGAQADSTNPFKEFNAKNESYFDAAELHVNKITDSILKNRIKTFVADGLKNYHAKTSGYSALLKAIESKNIQLNDLHTVLKIMRTFKVMETYQQENIPSAKPIQAFIKQLDKTIQLTDTLSKK